jgi:phosphoribosylformylglycinamidine cyclo-ligase
VGQVSKTKDFTYANSGVDRESRIRSKESLRLLDETFSFSRYGKVVRLPFGNIFPFGQDRFLDFIIECIGTKVFVAQLAEKYDTIAIDGIAMAVNDVIRSGAKPLAIADNIYAQVSDPPEMDEWMRGIVKGAKEAECVVPSGETGNVGELIRGLSAGKGFDMIFASIGEVVKEKVISGRNVKPGDAIIGLRSSGVHSNGLSLVRRILFKRWGGMYEPYDVPDGFERGIVQEVLEPTKIYVKPVLAVADQVKLRGAVHITGDAYLKLGKLAVFSPGIGFEFDNFSPQPIFTLNQDTATRLGGRISDEEMFRTFNMGWGFALIVDGADVDGVIEILRKKAVQAEQIGRVSNSTGVRVTYRGKKMILA